MCSANLQPEMEKKNSIPLSKRQRWLRRLQWFVIVYCLIGIGLYHFQDEILLHPTVLAGDYTFKFAGKWEEVQIPFNKEEVTNMVKFYPDDTVRRGVVLYFHGNKDNIEHYAGFVPAFTRKGYEVWMPDYPGFGKSTGEFSEKSLYDLGFALQQMAIAQYGKDSIVIYGKSLGTAVAAYTASVNPFHRLILETPYYSIPALFSYYAPIYPASSMSKYKFPTYAFLQEVKCPVTIFHGTGDWVVPYGAGVRLKQFLKPGDQFIKIPGGSHNNLAESATYQNSLDSLLSH